MQEEWVDLIDGGGGGGWGRSGDVGMECFGITRLYMNVVGLVHMDWVGFEYRSFSICHLKRSMAFLMRLQRSPGYITPTKSKLTQSSRRGPLS